VTAVIALVGPTAVGKSALALRLAEDLGAEIVSVDSMQAYRLMDIGTDKATAEMRARVPHHLLDLKEPSEELTVAEYQKLARTAIAEIAQRGKLPLLVGGSGLYFRAVVDDLHFPPRSPLVRSGLEERAEREGSHALYAELRELDPHAAAKIEPGNARRIVRALEVIELTGQPFSSDSGWDRYESRYDLRVAGLTLDREELYERIAARVDRMLSDGLVEEAHAVAATGMSGTARQALGYRQVLDGGPSAGPSDVRDEIVRATKRFARRQLSWFRADPRIAWFDAGQQGLVDRLKDWFTGAGALP
jgi:tRNA dimethylallyltransferase